MTAHTLSTTKAMQQFVDDELLRAPMVMDLALQAAIDAFQRGHATASPSERQINGELMLRLAGYRPHVVDRYTAALREQVIAEFARQPAPGKASADHATAALSLVDDDEVVVDVVISHTIEAIKSVAEYELRELLAFTSALIGDMDVGADHNPFRAETQARALWAAAQALPQSRGHQIAFMRHVATPLAQALRKNYAAACARLEEQGVEPGVYRTVIPPAGPRTPRTVGHDQRHQAHDLNAQVESIRRALPQPVGKAQPLTDASVHRPSQSLEREAGAASRGEKPTARPSERPSERPTEQPAKQPAKQLTEQLAEIFTAMLADRRLVADLHQPFARLQTFAAKAMAIDATLLARPAHPLWRFMDSLAHLALLSPGVDGEERAQLLRFTALLLDQLGKETRHTEQLYGWAIERLERFAANRLEMRCAEAERQISTMQSLEDRLSKDGPISTLHGAIDVVHLDTVPSELLDLPAPGAAARVADSPQWLLARRSGDWLRLFRKGGWVNSQLLWPGDRGEVWLFVDGDADEPWAIRRSALTLLHEEGLADVHGPRSLLLDAEDRLARSEPSRRAA